MTKFENLLDSFFEKSSKFLDVALYWCILSHALILFVVLFIYAKNPLEGVFSISFLLVLVFIGLVLQDEILED